MPDSLPIAAFILIGTSALLLAIGVTPLMRRLALQTGTVDKPAARKIHASPVPLLGGAAIYVAFILVLLFFGDRDYVNQTIGIFAGATLMIVMGVLDDRRGLGSYVKLLGQLLAATLLVYSGVQIQLFGGWIDILITLLWVVGITNALNLLDNMDGLSGGVAMIAAIYFTLLAAMSDQYLVGALAAALAGACAGFLVYNWNPSHIFMGDAGSLFLGFMLAAVAIKLRFPSNSVTVTWMIPLLVLGLPIFDTSMVFVSRLRRGKNPLTTPGKDHISHRLAHVLGSRREAVLVCYLLCCALGTAAVFVSQATFGEAIVLAAVISGLGVYTLWWMEFRRGGVRP
ncbi:MAG: undecaprenyl/decaprenyl-phosphate alpha-N-acetylglucosaminyl 1-phosphate transferase [Caldilinea sp.]|nr:undecaprenyl/decaprenyl-phosphate alpha-N-acetylglucosaminyl 1-phosphate transferase [Caldilinea sp.]MCB0067695.1 undecaprenyl/decaprenyl-phosphate alpha-N-acetylglucosaminyl 1-phosphate transferase [Caldilineaceae bacterium]MCB0039181.1 undecaprenyl/decaprenyl-phosphate alpha-N-acetylglucosaminyl 1-phosphate transferase [Caldilinea sp.]MCB0050935.1 undecaprenyl/decaprenyl-phosphate alpha-N-acetylglucosaminyl 1-phosphate transferase [Caldilinea sp.]MCB0134830.1 undecaprenyl/decaprenyl-phosph